MSSQRIKIILPLGLLGFALIAAAVMIHLRPDAQTHLPPEFAPLIRVLEAQSEDRILSVRTHGTVSPRTESTVISEVPGRIVEVAPSFAGGGFFEEGEILVRIDRRDYELALVQARGVVAQAKVRAELEKNQAELAREEWAELGQGEGSPLATRELQLEEARAAYAAALAAQKKAELNLSRTEIRAPYDGRVRRKMADVGQYVMPGIPVAVVYAVDYAEVRLPLPDRQLAFIDVALDFGADPSTTGAPEVRLSAEFAGEQYQWIGQIGRVEGEVDPLSRMVHVVAQVADPYGRHGVRPGGELPLSVGMFVEAEITGRLVKDAFLLPRNALRSGSRVIVVDKESRLRFRDVNVLREEHDKVVVTGGLANGDLICISAIDIATDGMKVRTSGSDRLPQPAEDAARAEGHS